MYMVAPDSSAHFVDADAHHNGRPCRSFFQHPFVQNALPFLISLAFHAGLVVFAIATYTVVKTLAPRVLEPPVIPDIGIPTDPLADARIITRENVDPMRSNLPVPTDADAVFIAKPKGELTAILSNTGGGNMAGSNASDPLIGVSANPGGDVTTGLPGSIGPDNGSGSVFGYPDGVSFMRVTTGLVGPKGGARRIIFLCDASGSMIQTFDTLRVELRKATDPLRPNFSYNVIFFAGNAKAPLALDSALRPATPEFKRKTAEFLERTSPVGETNPLPALQLAFQQKPDLIYLLTDGDFPDNKAVIDLIDQLNPARRVKINTILFVQNKAAALENAAFAETLKRIANDNGGQSKVANATELD